MRGRIESLLGIPAGAMWIGTFHGLTHRLLRCTGARPGCPRVSRYWIRGSVAIAAQVLKAMDSRRSALGTSGNPVVHQCAEDEASGPSTSRTMAIRRARQLTKIYQA